MNYANKERLYRKVNKAIDLLESRDIYGTLLLLEGLSKEIQDNVYI
tara:strand:- start:1716 stop:1853 length:138 start_codon:yes stop_codon:yes gene_type:complete